MVKRPRQRILQNGKERHHMIWRTWLRACTDRYTVAVRDKTPLNIIRIYFVLLETGMNRTPGG
jgi:hypothetical protein